MIKGTRSAIYMGAGLLGALSLTISSAFAAELSSLRGVVEQVKAQQLPCNRTEYFVDTPILNTPKGSFVHTQCQACSAKLQTQYGTVKPVYESAVAADASANASASATAQANAKVANVGQSDASQNKTSNTGADASKALAAKSGNASKVASAGRNCAKDIDSVCKEGIVAQSDMTMVKTVKDACNQLATASESIATDKAASSSGMGDMSQLASLLGAAAGPLAAMMGQQPTAETPMTPYDSGLSESFDTASEGVSTPAGTDGSKLADLSTNGMNIGKNETGGTSFKNPLTTGITGGAPSASMYNPYASDSEKSGAEYATAANGANSNGGAEGASMAGAGGMGSGSGHGKEATDAEKAALAAAAAAEAGMGEEYGVGGAGGRPSFIGLKAGAKAEEEFAGEGEGVLGDLGLQGEEGRGLASADELQGVGEEDGHTLFHVVHSKISEIKKRGSI